MISAATVCACWKGSAWRGGSGPGARSLCVPQPAGTGNLARSPVDHGRPAPRCRAVSTAGNRSRPVLVLALLGLLLPATPADAGPSRPTRPTQAHTLAAELDRILKEQTLRGARVSALVVALDDGSTVYEREPDLPVTPASNVKLLTAIAALETFGPTWRFETVVRAPAPPDQQGNVDQLCLVGGGDPALTSEQIWRLAADLRSRGVRRVRGGILVDDSLFADGFWHPAWGEVSRRAYHAPVGALNVNYGSFVVHVIPSLPGRFAHVSIDPPVDLFQLSGAVRTRSGSKRDIRMSIASTTKGERVRVSGAIGSNAGEATYPRRVSDPALYAGHVFRMQLEALGIAVKGTVRRGKCTSSAVELLRFRGRPLAEITRLFLKYSNNAISETLIKQLGLRGSGKGAWKEGIEATKAVLRRLGLWAPGMRLVDGSGLARDNAVPARVFVAGLRHAAQNFAYGPELLSALPLAGADGTLRERAGGARGAVRAKTGLLDGVAALSGLARAEDGEILAFSVLVDRHSAADTDVMRLLDRFAVALSTRER